MLSARNRYCRFQHLFETPTEPCVPLLSPSHRRRFFFFFLMWQEKRRRHFTRHGPFPFAHHRVSLHHYCTTVALLPMSPLSCPKQVDADSNTNMDDTKSRRPFFQGWSRVMTRTHGSGKKAFNNSRVGSGLVGPGRFRRS